MPITNLADRRMTVRRKTSILLGPVAVLASHAPTRQPATAAAVRVRLAGGTTSTGTVTVSGTVAGLPDSETLTFTRNDVLETVKLFTALSTITTSGLADEVTPPTITVDAVGRDGTAIHTSYVVVSGWPIRKDAGPPSWPAPVPGSSQTEDAWMYIDWTSMWEPRDGDVFIDERTAEEWQAVGHPSQHGGGLVQPHHWEVRVRRREGSSTT